jgi:hypothetical protein
MAEEYEVLAEPPLAIATVIDRHADDCPHGCAEHKHERVDVELGGVFDLAHLEPGTNVDVLVQAGLIRKVEAKKAKASPTPGADR